MIEFRNVSLSRGKKEILKNASFRCKRGEITAIIGRNGAGKTTALTCLTGENRFSGDIMLFGKSIKTLSPIQRAKKISYLPQILPDTPFTVYELSVLGRRPYLTRAGKLTEEDEKAIQNALTLTDMTGLSERRVNTLSGGEKQRAYLSMVLSQNTDVIALDEPSTFMDAAVEKEMSALLKMLSKEKGKTIVQVIHNLTRAASDADRIIILDQGTVACEMTEKEGFDTSRIEEIFSVKSYKVTDSNGKEIEVYL